MSLYILMNGAAARAEQLESVADNLANAETPGFKASRPAFQAFVPPGAGPKPAYAAAVQTTVDPRSGANIVTGEPLDVAPEGDAYIAVQRADGSRAYTRDGRLSVSSEGELVAAGARVLDTEGRPILVPPGTLPAITPEGGVEVEGASVGQIGLFQINGPIDRVGSTLVAPGQGAQVAPAETGVRVGEVEGSNVSAMEVTVQLISAQRHFDAAMQAIETYRKLSSADVGRLR